MNPKAIVAPGGRPRAALLALALLAGAQAAPAADTGKHPWYIGGDFIASFALLSDDEVRGSTGTVTKVKDDDFVIGAQGHLGRAFGLWRLDIEYAWRYRFDYNTDIAETNGSTTRLKNDVQTQSVMLNVHRDFDIGRSWRPYLGGGLGWVQNSSDVSRSTIGSGVTATREKDESDLAWSLMTGVRWDFSERWTGRLGYRFAYLGTIDTGAYPDGLTQKAEMWSNDVLLGVDYRF